ncbi:plastocyanin/azurin family copper-binding protein [Halorubellus litoreus]|uniref:Plastocyanin/azurin family copper-binding protein n=1 Tax=Halorubellus litoreus TaxID=755308 RepID=A0ABD5VJ99_9EURY
MHDIDRRTLIRFGGIATVTGLAGCTTGFRETETAADTEEPTETDAATTTSGGGGAPPGADVLGGPDDLESAPSVTAATLERDQGAGQFVFTPAVVWVEQGATVEWTIEGGSHSVTAYHEENGQPGRVPEDASAFDSGVLSAGESFEHTFETPGVHNYYCTPHRGLGMTGIVVVEASEGGPGTTDPSDVESDAEATALARQLAAAGLGDGGGGGDGEAAYQWFDATLDSYWYSLYNMSTNIAMSGNGVQFPHNEQQQQAFEKRVPAMLEAADVEKPPIANPNLNMAPFTEGDPHFTQQPVFDSGDGRPDASTLKWDMSKSSKTVSPSSVAWTHLKGVTWAKNFESHFDVLPPGLAAKFRAQMLTTLAQIGVNATLIAGGPDGNGALTKGDSLQLVSGFKPGTGEVTDSTTRPKHHLSMLWFLSNLNSLAQNGWFGYVNPEPLIPANKVQQLTDGMAKTTMNAFEPSDVVSMGSTRDLGLALGAAAWYGTQAGSSDLESMTASWANALADEVAANVDGDGRVAGSAQNQAATQGAVVQGLTWASELDGVDRTGLAADALGYLTDDLYDADAGTFASNADDDVYRYTARDVGDVTGGLNAADAVLDADVGEQYASFFDGTLNRGRLQRAERPPSRNANAEHALPLPPKAGGEFGQAAVYNQAVAYDTGADEWSVADDRFVTADALYAANQEIWISHWNGDFYAGRGVPGRTEEPP